LGVASVYFGGKTGRENQLRKKERKEVGVCDGKGGKKTPSVKKELF
jgi:hypothetical protein